MEKTKAGNITYYIIQFSLILPLTRSRTSCTTSHHTGGTMSKAEAESTGDDIPIRAQNNLGGSERVPQTQDKSLVSHILSVIVIVSKPIKLLKDNTYSA
jgi:hypothetical protein